LRREARKFLGYFVWKITILRQKIIFFPILGGRAGWAPPLDPPLACKCILNIFPGVICHFRHFSSLISL
jgi:hypothetical protein